MTTQTPETDNSTRIPVTLINVADGCWMEETGQPERTGRERCWRFDKRGRAYYCRLKTLRKADHPHWRVTEFTRKNFKFN